ncbi:MAG: glycosyltransferase family 2 protein [Chloroflexi bacterium]|nr:glycosyltransferase family 2 protein [Chloroflexota bacterium]
MNNPKVSIGLPVYNGEKYVSRAIESVLAQTYANFELIISDNASTDGTGAICQAYAANDSRIRYYRQEQNLGAAPNFNYVFELARGEYFQWLASDDMLAPEFLSRCVPTLDNDPTTVLCFCWAEYIDEQDRPVSTCELALRIDDARPRTRFHEILLGWHNSFYVFGLIRVSALKQTKLILPHTHGDTILIARLILLGRFQQVSEYLFKSRRHAAQSNEIYKVEVPCGLDTDAYASWYDTQGMSRPKYPNWRILSEFNQTLKGVNISMIDRMICRVYIARFGLRHIHCLLWDLGGLPRRFVAVTSALFLKKKYTVERKNA